MSKTLLLLFWIIWLLDVLMALFGYNEFMMGVFGRNASPSSKYLAMWTFLLVIVLLILVGSVYFKNHGQSMMALIIAAIPVVLALPYVLFVAVMMMGGKNNWR